MSDPVAIPVTRRQYKEMADGTLRVSIDVDPPYKQAFLRLFPSIDSPAAIAPLVNDFEQKQESEAQIAAREMAQVFTGTLPIQVVLKGGELCKLAAMFCNDPEFQNWLFYETIVGRDIYENSDSIDSDSGVAAKAIREICGIQSRRELDHDARAVRIFNENIRKPYLAHQGINDD